MKGCACLRPGECQGLGPKNEKQGTPNSRCCPGVLLPIVTESLVPRRPSHDRLCSFFLFKKDLLFLEKVYVDC